MQLCGQALRFFTGLQPLIKRVTTDYIRSMRSHDITQTFSPETRRSLPLGVRVSSSRVEFPKARALFRNCLMSKQQTCGACEDCEFGVCFNLSRLQPYVTLWSRDVHAAAFEFLCCTTWLANIYIYIFISEDDDCGHKQRCINMFSKFPLPSPTPPHPVTYYQV